MTRGPGPDRVPIINLQGPRLVQSETRNIDSGRDENCSDDIGGHHRVRATSFSLSSELHEARIKWLVKSSDLHLYLPCCSDSVPQAIVHSGVIVFYLHPAAAQVERKLNRSRINKKF